MTCECIYVFSNRKLKTESEESIIAAYKEIAEKTHKNPYDIEPATISRIKKDIGLYMTYDDARLGRADGSDPERTLHKGDLVLFVVGKYYRMPLKKDNASRFFPDFDEDDWFEDIVDYRTRYFNKEGKMIWPEKMEDIAVPEGVEQIIYDEVIDV